MSRAGVQEDLDYGHARSGCGVQESRRNHGREGGESVCWRREGPMNTTVL